jgi:hypothetical protein
MEQHPKLMSLEDWRKEYFVTPPSSATVRRWANNGLLPNAHKIGSSWYIEVKPDFKFGRNEDDTLH